MSGLDWMEAYRAAFDVAQERLAADRRDSALIACGFANNVDLVATLTPETMATLIDGRRIRLHGQRQTTAASPDELVTSIVQHVAAGLGVDIPIANPETQEWLIAQIAGRHQLGGTSAQTAKTLDALGFPTLIHLSSRSPEQIAAFGPLNAMYTPTGDDIVPVADAEKASDPTMWHVALEYPQGLELRANGQAFSAPRGSRIIVSYDPINCALQIDPRYSAAVAGRIDSIGRMLVSGYSHPAELADFDRAINQTAAATKQWRALRPDLAIHCELGAVPSPEQLRRIVEALAPHITSVGMNLDELRELAIAWNVDIECAPWWMRSGLEAIGRELPGLRIVVHDGTHSDCRTFGDPGAERDALLFGMLVASTRARIGTFPTFADLAMTLDCCQPQVDGISELAAMQLSAAADGAWIVAAPALAVPNPTASVGLGDSFTAGMLALL